MENVIKIYNFARVFEKLASIELSEDIIAAITKLAGLSSEDYLNMPEMLEAIEFVKNDPDYKYLLLDKLDLLLRNTIQDLSEFPPKFAQLPETYKTFSNKKLDLLLSADYEQLKMKLQDVIRKEYRTKDEKDLEKLRNYKEYIKDLMQDKGRANFYRAEIKFLMRVNNAMENIKTLVNNILLKANNAVESLKKSQELKTEEVLSPQKPSQQKPATTTKKRPVKKENEELINEESINEEVVDKTYSNSVVRVIKAIEFIQENIGESLRTDNFETDSYKNIKNTLLENLVNIGILSYDSTSADPETLNKFIGLLKKYKVLVEKYFNDTSMLINSKTKIVKRVKDESGQVSHVKLPSELLKFSAMLENHLKNVNEFIIKLEKLYSILPYRKLQVI